MCPNAGHRGSHERLRGQVCTPTRATGALTGDLGDEFVPQRGPPGPPRQTYLTHLCSDAGHQGLYRRLRARTNIVTPARGVLTWASLLLVLGCFRGGLKFYLFLIFCPPICLSRSLWFRRPYRGSQLSCRLHDQAKHPPPAGPHPLGP